MTNCVPVPTDAGGIVAGRRSVSSNLAAFTADLGPPLPQVMR